MCVQNLETLSLWGEYYSLIIKHEFFLIKKSSQYNNAGDGAIEKSCL